MHFKIDVLKNFTTFTGKHLCWLLQAFFYRTPKVATSGFLWQQILFLAESDIYSWQSPKLLLQTLLRTSVKKEVLRNFANFTGKHLCWSPFLTKLQTWNSNTGVVLWSLQNFHLSTANYSLWKLFFYLDCPFYNLHFWLKLIHMF